MKNNIEIISLIYKSVDYLDFIVNQLKINHKVDGWDVGIRIVANDATSEVLDRLKNSDIPYSIYSDPYPDQYYLNRVYRCWNFAGKSSEYDNICFVNSDMAFSNNWLSNLLKFHNGKYIPTSRLVESGKMLSGMHGISYDCGRKPSEFDSLRWKSYVEKISEDSYYNDGLYMPCIFEKSKFINSGMYPEGNIYVDGIGTLTGRKICSGDKWFFNKLKTDFNMQHITVFNYIVYHIQEGEMSE
jgi:hypothetical protein